jgi:hypothetical protein
MTATTFNANHTSSFRHKKDSNKTELSKHIWKLKENNQDYTIKWSRGGIKTLQFMFGRNILHFERHIQR